VAIVTCNRVVGGGCIEKQMSTRRAKGWIVFPSELRGTNCVSGTPAAGQSTVSCADIS